jgi:hypothetical protein
VASNLAPARKPVTRSIQTQTDVTWTNRMKGPEYLSSRSQESQTEPVSPTDSQSSIYEETQTEVESPAHSQEDRRGKRHRGDSPSDGSQPSTSASAPQPPGRRQRGPPKLNRPGVGKKLSQDPIALHNRFGGLDEGDGGSIT